MHSRSIHRQRPCLVARFIGRSNELYLSRTQTQILKGPPQLSQRVLTPTCWHAAKIHTSRPFAFLIVTRRQKRKACHRLITYTLRRRSRKTKNSKHNAYLNFGPESDKTLGSCAKKQVSGKRFSVILRHEMILSVVSYK